MIISNRTASIIIGICDDVEIYRKSVLQLCEDYFIRKNIEYQIVEFVSGEEVIKYKNSLDILILDIEMEGIDGIEVKRYLIEHGREIAIIFMTNHGELVKEAFGKNVFGFVEKREEKEDLHKVLEIVCTELLNYCLLEIENDGRDGFIRSDSIIRMEVNNHYIDIHAIKGRYFIRGCLKDMEVILNKYGFYRIDRKHMLNLKYVDTVQNGITLSDGYQYKVSGRVYGRFKKAYKQYIMEKVR